MVLRHFFSKIDAGGRQYIFFIIFFQDKTCKIWVSESARVGRWNKRTKTCVLTSFLQSVNPRNTGPITEIKIMSIFRVKQQLKGKIWPNFQEFSSSPISERLRICFAQLPVCLLEYLRSIVLAPIDHLGENIRWEKFPFVLHYKKWSKRPLNNRCGGAWEPYLIFFLAL